MIELQADTPTGIAGYLRERQFLRTGETLMSVTKAGEGNMNVTLLVTTSERQFVLKQSRPYVAKYPSIPAPIARIDVEYQYLSAAAEDPELAGHHPAVLDYDAANYTLLLEYLEGAEDMIYVYEEGRSISRTQLRSLLNYLSVLHRVNVKDFPANEELKALNAAHIFELPFNPDNGFPLDDFLPGLANVAAVYQYDKKLRAKALELGAQYRAAGRQLIHGDFYPGSFMRRKGEVFVIDGEFAHRGAPEFDLGVLMAHLLLSEAEPELLTEIDRSYRKPPGFNAKLAREFCYVEVIRRIIGIAQLPLSLTLGQRKSLLEQARIGLQ
ncbi:phosphotransferase [Lewinella sp. 4G2]|uniref:phosphotransferase n=1 Tax=Lewinella sp. 4G2 TaxID=1803372 RepID=UPI0007B48320|nr:phosphotransferase [Lewinella sp. 4G2]OAV43469.1 hypothetical protein A3850_002695 [Lewinella sp. 4G2]